VGITRDLRKKPNDGDQRSIVEGTWDKQYQNVLTLLNLLAYFIDTLDSKIHIKKTEDIGQKNKM
jgi:hypothetical protein